MKHGPAILFVYQGHERLTYPAGHPFRPERARMLLEILERQGILSQPWHRQEEALPAAREEILRFHSSEYVDALERAGRGEFSVDMVRFGLGGPECPAFEGVYELAALAAGATLAGARAVVEGGARLAFNPVGGFHHAGPAHAEGFCYLNDVVLACGQLAEQGLRVACVDIDVHHGNGTEDAFLSDPRVLTISVHESGKTLYPWRGTEDVLGEGAGRGYNVNIPLPEGTDDIAFERAFREIVLPLLNAFAPHVIVLEIGMDVLQGDPLAHLRMTNNAFADVLPSIRRLERPVLVLGGGGYHPHNTARGWALAWSVLCDAEPEDEYAGLVGGVFLGDAERAGSLRDMKSFASGGDREMLDREIDRLVEFHRRHTFPVHSLA